jgi:glycosyltransferase involved in cell wall biosynthesis
MNILVTNYMETTAPGGINKVVSEIGERLAKQGHIVTILQPNILKRQSQETYRSCHIIRVKSTLGTIFHELTPRLFFSFERMLTQLTPDVVHVHGYATLFSVQILNQLKRKKYPMIYSPHFDIESHNSFAGRHFWNAFNKHVGNRNFEIADEIICASNFESTNVQRIFGVSEKRLEVIPHGVSRIHIVPREKKDYIDLIYFGYLFELKGVQFILKALHRLKYDLGERVVLTIIGEGDYKPELVALSRKMKIEDSITWYPFLPLHQLQEKLENADIFLLLSRSENYGISVAEALSMGVACIVTKTTALTEFLNEPGCFGINYPPDPSALAELIVRVHRSNVRTGPLSDKIRTWDRIARDYECIYENCLDVRQI